MSDIIKLKRSGVAGAVPSSLELGEPALNYADGKLYYRNLAGSVVALAGSGGGGSSSLVTAATVAGFPATGSTANIYVATDTNRIYRWDSANSIYVELGPLASSGDTLLRSYLVPTAPSNVVATAGNAQVSLTWTAASSLSQIPITDYLVQSSTDNGTTWALASDTVSTATSATITSLTNGTAYTFRVAGVNGVGTGAYSSASSAVTPVAGDPLWSSVQLLITGDTSVGDVSSYSRSVTANGNAAVSTAQKKWGAGSISFNGSTDWLAVSSGPSIQGSDFTLEMWFYPTGSMSGTFGALVDTRTGGSGSASSNGFYFGYTSTANELGWYDGAAVSFVARAAVTPSAWNHVAVTRSSSTLSVYVNGTRASQATVSTNYSNPLALIGKSWDNFHARGFIDDFRLTVGTARYTGSTIPVPTANFPTVGSSGVPTDGYFSNVSLLLHMDGSGSTFVDSSATPKTITANGGATQSADQSKWGGKSLSLSGTGGSFLATNQSSEFNLAGDFAAECWIYPTQSASDNRTFLHINAGGNQGLHVYQFGTNLRVDDGLTADFDGVGLLTPNAWQHVALSRAGSTLNVYVNGVRVTSRQTGGFGTPNRVQVGRFSTGGITSDFAGFVDDVRITNGSNRSYTGATIPVPAAAFPDA